MLPSFTPGLPFVQNHIHLGAVPNDGSSPLGFDSDGAPPYQINHIQKRVPKYEGFQSLERAIDGTPHDHVLRTDDKVSPLVFTGIIYEVRVDLPTLDILQHMVYRRVYLIDNRHPNAGITHTPHVRIMYFDHIEYEENLDPMLTYNIVNISFTDMDTVSAL